jgi:uncharacterized protein
MGVLLLGLALGVGLLLGLLGGGGSILTVPLLVYVGGLGPREAIAGSLVVVGVSSAWAALMHACAGRVHFRTVTLFGAAGMAGAFVGGRLSALLPPALLVVAFALVMIAAAVAMLRRGRGRSSTERATAPRHLPLPRMLLVGVGVGVLAGLVGVGGGFLIVPALVMLGLPIAEAVGTSLAVITLQSVAGYAAHAGRVELDWTVVLGVTTAAIVGSIVGPRVIRFIPTHLLRKAFAAFVLVSAASILLGEVPEPWIEAAQARLLESEAWSWLIVALSVAATIVALNLARGRRSRVLRRPRLGPPSAVRP